MGFEVLFKGSNLMRLFEGAWVAVKISFISVIISIVLGVIFGMMMTRKNTFSGIILKIYLEIVRIMPQLVLLFVVYFGTTKAIGLNLSAENAAIIVFSFWGAAEMADLVRGALSSIPVIQYESSMALGFDNYSMYIYVIIPQIVRRMIPQSINLITRMIKTTSLVMMIGIVDVLKTGQQIIEANRTSSPNAAFGVYLAVFVLYFIICWPVSSFSKYLERKWA